MSQEITTTNILSLFETTKEQRRSFAEDVVIKMEDGATDSLQIHLQIKSMEDLIKMLTDSSEKTNKNVDLANRYKKLVLDAAEKNGKKFQLHNAEFQIKEVGSTFDWSNCNDPEIIDLLDQQEKVKEKVKQRQDFLKTVPAGGMDVRVVDEMVTVYPPAKRSTTSVSVTLK